MGRVRAVLTALGRDELSVAARTALGAVVVFVPFGSVVLLTRWSPVRRMLQKLGHPVRDAECTPGSDEPRPVTDETMIRRDAREVEDEPEVHEVPPHR